MTANTPKGERRRAALLDAAAELFARNGFDALRHRAVAERAGLPLASTTYYFDSLDELVTAAVEQHARAELDRGRQQAAALPPAHRNLEVLADLVLEQLLGAREDTVDADYDAVLLRYERLVATGRRPYLRPLMRTLAEELRVLLGEILARSGFPTGRAGVDRLIVVVDGAVVNALVEVNPDPRRVAREVLLTELTAQPEPPLR